MKGIHHLGLSVSKLDDTSAFFCEFIGCEEVRRVPEYPAIFVSNESVMFSLWQVSEASEPFDRKKNIGLHHLAITVESEKELNSIYEKLRKSLNVEIEFPPEFLREGPAKHMICYEPSGIRVEFIWTP